MGRTAKAKRPPKYPFGREETTCRRVFLEGVKKRKKVHSCLFQEEGKENGGKEGKNERSRPREERVGKADGG